MVQSWTQPDSEWENKFNKEKACKLKVDEIETNEEMKHVQTC